MVGGESYTKATWTKGPAVEPSTAPSVTLAYIGPSVPCKGVSRNASGHARSARASNGNGHRRGWRTAAQGENQRISRATEGGVTKQTTEDNKQTGKTAGAKRTSSHRWHQRRGT